MSKPRKHTKQGEPDPIPLWDDLNKQQSDIAKDISTYLNADMMCGHNGCAACAADPLLERALEEIRYLRWRVQEK